MHEGIKPDFGGGHWLCAQNCKHCYDGECDITAVSEWYCIPWYQNRIEELEARLDKKEAIERIEAGKRPVVLGPDGLPENLALIQICIIRMNKDMCLSNPDARNGGDPGRCEGCPIAPKETDATTHLLNSEANAEHLRKSVAQAEAGEAEDSAGCREAIRRMGKQVEELKEKLEHTEGLLEEERYGDEL